MFGIETVQEFYALLKLYFSTSQTKGQNPNKDYCYQQLEITSRSFSTVIQQLPKDLQDPICIYYLVLRALDTIEDDPKLKTSNKSAHLISFYKEIEKKNSLESIGVSKHQELMKNFDRCEEVYLSLPSKYREIIKLSTQKMGFGMNKYLDKEIETISEYNDYCYYVAGLVGEGLTEMFNKSNIIKDLKVDNKLSISMGLFLQKTNIIRDFLEDCEEDRVFWPKEIWEKYVKDVEQLKVPENRLEAVFCLNEMIMNALEHIPDVLEYLNRLYPKESSGQEHGIFAFTAIPQVMAIATLAECYNNPKVFQKGSCKIRKGIAARLFVETKNVKEVKKIFFFYLKDIKDRMNNGNIKDYEKSLESVKVLLKSTDSDEQFSTGTSFKRIFSYAIYNCSFFIILLLQKRYYRKS